MTGLPEDGMRLFVIGGTRDWAVWCRADPHRTAVHLAGPADLRRVMGVIPPFRVVLLPGHTPGMGEVLEAVQLRGMRGPADARVEWFQWNPADCTYTQVAAP